VLKSYEPPSITEALKPYCRPDDQTTLAEEPPKPTECSVDICDLKPKARGLCPKHYKAKRRADGLDN
jgi:hypothetical protein